MRYETETSLKETALQLFWKQHFPSPLLSPLIASPRGRGYRTVTKRRAFRRRGSVTLGLIGPGKDGSYEPFEAVECAIEPEGHAAIYQKVQEAIGKPYAAPLAEALNYVIIKGSYTEYTLIFNVRTVKADVVRASNTLSKSLTHHFKEITGVFLHQAETTGRYYLGRTSGARHSLTRKIYGNSQIYQRICGKTFLFSPLAFSQVNQSMVGTFVATAAQHLELTKESILMDLYCGYGMFALCLAEQVRSVVAVEIDADAVASGIANSRRQKVHNVRFVRCDITAESVPRLLLSVRGDTTLLLDPPRSGTAQGVIECIAARKPERVLHIFCNIDIMRDELTRWTDNGYVISNAIPFDMFPGTPLIEMMVLLTPIA